MRSVAMLALVVLTVSLTTTGAARAESNAEKFTEATAAVVATPFVVAGSCVGIALALVGELLHLPLAVTGASSAAPGDITRKTVEIAKRGWRAYWP